MKQAPLLSLLFGCVIFATCTIFSCAQVIEQSPKESAGKFSDERLKMKGAHVFGRIDSSNITQFQDNNIDWLALVPWAHQNNYQSADLRSHRGDSLQIIKRNEQWLRQINTTQEAGYKIFLKPHLWLGDDTTGYWRSDIYPTSPENWEKWKSSYREFILRYAKIAEDTGVELFCVGVEFTKLTKEYPDFWRSIIKEVRAIYSGELTYAANWYKEYEDIEFWDELDYIGIQAYFPLTSGNNPTVKEISKGWDKFTPQIKTIQQKFNKPVLFTELGYKSTIDSATEPWTWVDYSDDHQALLSFETQTNCYTAFFETIWKSDWMAGLFIWQMRVDHDINRGKNNIDFTPQSKPAQKIITEAYGKH